MKLYNFKVEGRFRHSVIFTNSYAKLAIRIAQKCIHLQNGKPRNWECSSAGRVLACVMSQV